MKMGNKIQRFVDRKENLVKARQTLNQTKMKFERALEDLTPYIKDVYDKMIDIEKEVYNSNESYKQVVSHPTLNGTKGYKLLQNISFTDTYVKATGDYGSYYSCGDYTENKFKIKIPNSYMDMSDEELRIAHYEWIKIKLDKKLDKQEASIKANKERTLKRKLEEIEKLKSEM